MRHVSDARLARSTKPFVVLSQPRIASHCVKNHHPERLAQVSIPKRDCRAA